VSLPFRAAYNQTPMDSEFLDCLSNQLKANKSASCRRAIERLLELVKKDYQAGGYKSVTEAEREFRRLVESDETCK
jgi:hypothetical protein